MRQLAACLVLLTLLGARPARAEPSGIPGLVSRVLLGISCESGARPACRRLQQWYGAEGTSHYDHVRSLYYGVRAAELALEACKCVPTGYYKNGAPDLPFRLRKPDPLLEKPTVVFDEF